MFGCERRKRVLEQVREFLSTDPAPTIGKMETFAIACDQQKIDDVLWCLKHKLHDQFKTAYAQARTGLEREYKCRLEKGAKQDQFYDDLADNIAANRRLAHPIFPASMTIPLLLKKPQNIT